jgi:hypothetical protein
VYNMAVQTEFPPIAVAQTEPVINAEINLKST